MRTVAIVGASLAGLSAARALRSLGYDGRVVLVGAEKHPPYDRPPLSKDFLLGTRTRDDLALCAPDDEALDLDWRLGAPAVRLDPGLRTIMLAGGAEIRADGVVIATGAHSNRLPAAGGLAGVHTLRTLEDAVALRDALLNGGPLVIIGGGFIGAEVSSTAGVLGVDVTVVEAQATPLAGPLGAEMGRVCAALHGDNGVRLLTNTRVDQLIGSSSVQAVRLADGRDLPAAAVLVAIGAQPAVGWLEGSGLELDRGVRTDATCATNIPGVVATGDCAHSYHTCADGPLRVEHWTHALEQPAIAVATLLAGERASRPYEAVPYFWSDQYGVRIQFAGHRRDGDTVRVIEGNLDERSFLAVYERDGVAVAAVAMNQTKQFTRVRRRLPFRVAHLKLALG